MSDWICGGVKCLVIGDWTDKKLSRRVSFLLVHLIELAIHPHMLLPHSRPTRRLMLLTMTHKPRDRINLHVHHPPIVHLPFYAYLTLLRRLPAPNTVGITFRVPEQQPYPRRLLRRSQILLRPQIGLYRLLHLDLSTPTPTPTPTIAPVTVKARDARSPLSDLAQLARPYRTHHLSLDRPAQKWSIDVIYPACRL